ncbi:MAG: hypothetical protein OES09_04605 [Gammaproteobacteria bacterium]|nr:hypothetical protein [Gammaproteobacteria bacterium]
MATLTDIDGVDRAFSEPVFGEAVLRLARPVPGVLRALEAQGIVAGLDLGLHYPELGNALLTGAGEMRTSEDLAQYASHLGRIIARRSQGPPCATPAR